MALMSSHHRSELKELGLAVRWLDQAHAKNAFDFAMRFCSSTHYGLEPATVCGIEHLLADSDGVARAWLKEKFPGDGTVQVVFGPEDVGVLDASAFVENWRNMFWPGRDDVFVLHNRCRKVFFYCHEDQLEVGERCQPVS